MTVIPQLRGLASYVNHPEGSILLWLQQVTAVAVFSFCILVSGIQYVGEPIQCVQDGKDEDAAINEHVMNSFCFISSTYTVVTKNDCGVVGVGPNVRKHSYYIWVPFALLFQSITFLIPNSYWNYCEGDLVKNLIHCVTDGDPSIQHVEMKIRKIAGYFHKRLSTHRLFAFAWIFRDFLAFAVLLGNFFLTDSLLGGRFINYGINVVAADETKCPNPMDELFPKVTKCTFYKFGAAGGLQNIDSLCVMALNVINEKIYTILWFWFFILIPVYFLSFTFKIGRIMFFICLSKSNLKKMLAYSWIRLIMGIPGFATSLTLTLFANRFQSSDWIFFCQLINNLSCATGKNFIFNVTDFIIEEDAVLQV